MPSVMGTSNTWELQIYSFPSRGTRRWPPLEISKMRAFVPITPPLPSPSELNCINQWYASKRLVKPCNMLAFSCVFPETSGYISGVAQHKSDSKDVKITASLNSNVFHCLLFSISERKNVGSNEAAALKEIGNILWGRMC